MSETHGCTLHMQIFKEISELLTDLAKNSSKLVIFLSTFFNVFNLRT